MARADVESQLEQISERFVLLGTSDRENTAALREEVAAVQMWCVEHGHPEAAAIASSADELLIEIEGETAADPSEVLGIIGEAIRSLQSLLIGESDPGSVARSFEEKLSSVRDVNREETPSADESVKSAETGEVASGSSSDSGDGTNPFAQDVDLLIDFVNEATEHIDTVEGFVLNLERGHDLSESLNGVFRAFHTIKGVSGLLGLEDIANLSRETEDLLEAVRGSSVEWTDALSDAAFDAADEMKVLLRCLRAKLEGTTEPATSHLERVLAKLSAVASEIQGRELPEAEAETQPSSSVDTETLEMVEVLESYESAETSDAAVVDTGPTPVESSVESIVEEIERKQTLQSQVEVASDIQARESGREVGTDSIRVDASKLDRLVETIGELVIMTSVVRETVGAVDGDPEDDALKQLEKIARQLQDVGSTLRMVPLRTTFRKLSRLVRNLVKSEGKMVNLVLSGEECELDRTIVDRLSDPLVHIVRNAIDHGIESDPQERVRAGKSARGRIDVRAFHQGGGVVIEIEDDGRGFDTEAIEEKSRALGILGENESISSNDLHRLVFRPGFSTAREVTDISGRGVGMDVVKENVESLRGQIEIFTERGQGTRLRIRLPLTIATIDGMIVAVGEQRFVLPTASILRTIQPTSSDLLTMLGKGELVNWEGQSLPLIRLSEIFGIESDAEDVRDGLVVIVEQQDDRVGLLVDELLGQRETVIKNLGGLLRETIGISGGAIMPDGSVGLILDIPGVVRLGTGQESAAFKVTSAAGGSSPEESEDDHGS